MPWDDASANLTNLSAWNVKPAGKAGFVRVEKGHLYVGAERLKLFGVNIVFGAVAPQREEAAKLAARLARLGVNAVRFHHMDSRSAPDGLLQKDKRTIDPEALDRLDYFIAALKREGVYSDLNLHVGRTYPGFADWGEDTPKYWKGIDLFYPPMIDLQKEYARDLLLHRNPYTGNRYVEESAVALVEINNEDGLLREWRAGSLDGMTEPYRGELKRRWNEWLRSRYADTAALRRAWGVREEAPGESLFSSAANVKSGEVGWNPQFVGSAKGTLKKRDDGVLELETTKPGTENWHTQLHQYRIVYTAGRPYTVTLRLRADKPARVSLQAVQAHAPWKSLWQREVKVDTEWREYRFVFATAESDAVARFTIGNLGRFVGRLYLDGADLRSGGALGLKAGENLETTGVGVPAAADLASLTPEGQRDWLRFLWETESAYWTDFSRYLRTELGVRQPIVGTQVSYSPAPIQARLDVVDGHAYWQHPRFPGKPWDVDDWLIGNSPMAGIDGGGTIADLAFRRVPLKPFIVTEYNHSAPSHFQGEALPLAAAYAGLQDWDGLFLYSWGAHNKDWTASYIHQYFDSHANPVKVTSLIASAALFRRGDVAAAVSGDGLASEGAAEPKTDLVAWLDALRSESRMPGADTFGAPRNSALTRQVGIGTQAAPRIPLPTKSVTGELSWGLTGPAGPAVAIDSARSKALIGYRLGLPIDSGGVELELLSARNDWGTLIATLIEGKDFSSSGHVLLTALGQVENTGQRWLDEKKTTLGRNFGNAPTLVEGIAARVRLPIPAARVRAWSLDERGSRREEIVVSGEDRATLEIGERYRALWYELELK